MYCSEYNHHHLMYSCTYFLCKVTHPKQWLVPRLFIFKEIETMIAKVQSELWCPISLSVGRRDNCVKCQLNVCTEYTGGQWTLHSEWTETCNLVTTSCVQKIKATLFVFAIEVANRLKLARSPETILPAKICSTRRAAFYDCLKQRKVHIPQIARKS